MVGYNKPLKGLKTVRVTEFKYTSDFDEKSSLYGRNSKVFGIDEDYRRKIKKKLSKMGLDIQVIQENSKNRIPRVITFKHEGNGKEIALNTSALTKKLEIPEYMEYVLLEDLPNYVSEDLKNDNQYCDLKLLFIKGNIHDDKGIRLKSIKSYYFISKITIKSLFKRFFSIFKK